MDAGERFPDYVLIDDSGAEFDSRSMAGKRYVLYFYPKDNTGGCTTEAKEFTAASPRFAELGMEVIGVSRDSTTTHQNFKRKQELTIRLLTDADHSLMENVGAWGLKTNYGKTFATCPATFTLFHTASTFPSLPMMNVVRFTPSKVFP